jgi:long-chain acyl-CoA synthetase
VSADLTYRALTLSGGLHAAARRDPVKIAARCAGEALTYAQLSERVHRVANAAHHGSKLAPGQHVALLAPNCLEYLELVAGLAQAGLAVVTANPHLTATEFAAVCADAEVRAVFAHAGLAELARASGVSAEVPLIVIGPEYAAWRDQGAARALELPLEETTPFCISYTSGTTGRPKGVMLSHRSRALTFLAMAQEYGCYGIDDRSLCLAPLYHGAGFAFAFAPVFLGGEVTILPKFDPEQTLRELAARAATNTFMVPTHFNAIFALPDAVRARYRHPHLRALISNAAPLPQSAKERIIEYFGDGLLFEAYGSTEGGIVSNLRPADQRRKLQCVGQPFPCTELAILDEQGRAVAADVPGEVFSRSPYLFNGYWKQPQATAETMRAGWFSAGDLGRIDAEGFLYIEGRKKDMILSGGVNVYPREIEEILQHHPAIAEAAVVGVKDDYWGEAVVACVVERQPGAVGADELESLCRARLAPFKRPKRYEFVPALPRNPSGKILKRVLREQLERREA